MHFGIVVALISVVICKKKTHCPMISMIYLVDLYLFLLCHSYYVMSISFNNNDGALFEQSIATSHGHYCGVRKNFHFSQQSERNIANQFKHPIYHFFFSSQGREEY
jgi:hypothetical protein